MPLGTLPPNRRKANVQRSIVSFVARQHMTKNVLFWTRLERRCQRTFGLDADACKAIAAALQADHGRCWGRRLPPIAKEAPMNIQDMMPFAATQDTIGT